MINIARTTENILGAIRDGINKGFNGKTCIGYEKIALDSLSTPKLLTVPSGALSAEITVETSDTSSYVNSVRYTLVPVNNGSNKFAPGSATVNSTASVTGYATSTEGVPLGDYDTIEIMGPNNLSTFTAILNSAVGTATTTTQRFLKVQYFK